MKAILEAFNIVRAVLNKWFIFLSSVGSFVGIYILFINNERAINIALYFFCAMMLVFTSTLIYTLLRILEVRNKEFESRSSFIKYETLNGNNITYEVYKLIQAKKSLLTQFEYGFKWSGTHLPVVTSDLQEVINVVDVNDPTNYDKAILRFKRPLYYNKCQVIHFKAQLDDTDKQSSLHVESRVFDEVDIIHFRIILKHVPRNYAHNAILQRKRMNASVNANFENIKEIPFDRTSKSYEYHLIYPEIGYYYRITWQKV